MLGISASVANEFSVMLGTRVIFSQVLPHLPASTPQLHHLVRCWARETPGSLLQLSSAVLAASTAATTSSDWAWRQLAKYSPRERNGGGPRSKKGEAVLEQERVEISRDSEQVVRVVPSSAEGLSFIT